MINFRGAWDRLKAVLSTTKKQVDDSLKEASREEIDKVADKIRSGLVTQNPGGQGILRSISIMNMDLRRRRGIAGDLALISHGELFDSIGVYEKDGVYVAGVLPGTTRRQQNPGFSMASLAEIQENGAVLHSGLGVIVVPPRPFIRPVYQEYLRNPKGAVDTFLGKIKKVLGL